MPHVIVKLWPGKSEKQKVKLAGEITKAVMHNVKWLILASAADLAV
jgi:phenylpyruvate tautomerase PptA (4-oxalocrotonate tautomerase family)